jgi:hypothetical protein
MNFKKYFGVKKVGFFLGLVLGKCVVLGWGFGDCLKLNLDIFFLKASSYNHLKLLKCLVVRTNHSVRIVGQFCLGDNIKYYKQEK